MSNKVAFIFTGQGAEWPHMGVQLMRDQATFRSTIRALDMALKDLPHSPTWSIETILLETNDSEVVSSAEFAPPLLTAVQVALVDLLAEHGIFPSAVVGHSTGELAAAYAAGALSKEEVIKVAFYRGYVCRTLSTNAGGMAVVGLSRNEASPYFQGDVVVGCENSRTCLSLSGDVQTLEKIISAIKKTNPDLLALRIPVGIAYHHSAYLKSSSQECYDLIESQIKPQQPRIPFHSSVTETILQDAADFAAEYWIANIKDPCMFYSAIRSLLNGPEQIHLEIGPHSALEGILGQTYQEHNRSIHYDAPLRRDRHDNASFLEFVKYMDSLGCVTTQKSA